MRSFRTTHNARFQSLMDKAMPHWPQHTMQHGSMVRIAGLVRMRQRPETASGVTFVTLEDETGMVNVIVWQTTVEQQYRVLNESRLLCVWG